MSKLREAAESVVEAYSRKWDSAQVGFRVDELRDALAEPDLVEAAEKTRIIARCYRLALAAIANDERLPCRCGIDYTDGEPCPKCTAAEALEMQLP